MENLKKGRKNKRKVGDKNVDPTLIAKQIISPTKKFMASQDDSKDLFCGICKVEFNDISKKEKHMTVIHKEAQKAKVEKKAVASSAKEPTDKPKEFHPCPNCQERFDSKTQLKKHLQNVHPKPKHPGKSKQGPKGGFVPTTTPRPPPGPPGPPMSVARMMPAPEEEDEGKEIFCEECGVEFDKRLQLVQHMKSEHDEDFTQGDTATAAKTVTSQEESDEEGEDLETPELEEFIPMNVHRPGQIFMDGFEIAEEVVHSDNEEISRLSSGFAKLAHRPDQHLTFPPRGNDVEFYEEEDISDEEMESQENSEDSEEYSSGDEVMIESPKRAAEEITLDEDSDEEIIVEKVRNEKYEEELNFINQYEKFLADEKAWDVLTNDNNEDKVRIIQERAWFAKPRNWKPASQWETWNATVKQICAHYKLIDFRLNDNQRFSSFDKFSNYVTGPMKDINPKMNEVMLYKWKKAKWLQTLDPVIPDHMKILEETLDDDDE